MMGLNVLKSQARFELTIETTELVNNIFQSSISGLGDGDQLGIFDAQGMLNSGDCARTLVSFLSDLYQVAWNGTSLI